MSRIEEQRGILSRRAVLAGAGLAAAQLIFGVQSDAGVKPRLYRRPKEKQYPLYDFGSPFCASRMRMRLDMSGVNHQPFQIRVVGDNRKQPGKDAKIAPAEETVAAAFPMTIVRRKIAPWCPGSQFP